jgi:hypothetical protein
MEIVFEDPSEAALLRHQGSGGKYLEWAIELRQHVGKWALLPDEVPRTKASAAGTAQNIRLGKMKGFTKGEYDAVADGIRVHVKFLGVKSEPGEPGEPGEPEDPEDPEAQQQQGSPLRAVPGPPGRTAPPDQVRAWAQNNGFNVPARGRMPDNIWAAYEKAHAPKETVPGY